MEPEASSQGCPSSQSTDMWIHLMYPSIDLQACYEITNYNSQALKFTNQSQAVPKIVAN